METGDWDFTLESQGFYDRFGYLIMKSFFANSICDDLLECFEKLADPNFGAIMNPDRKFDERKCEASAATIRSVITDADLVGVIGTLQGTEVCALMSQVLFKRVGSPFAGQAWSPHQDNSYPRAKDGSYITVNIFLSDADKENGCLYVYPGSHKAGLLPFEPVLSFHEKPGTNPGNKVQVSDRWSKCDLVVRKGDLLIMNGNLVHGSYPNVSTARSRPLYSISYINFGVPFWPGDPERSDKRVMRLH